MTFRKALVSGSLPHSLLAEYYIKAFDRERTALMQKKSIPDAREVPDARGIHLPKWQLEVMTLRFRLHPSLQKNNQTKPGREESTNTWGSTTSERRIAEQGTEAREETPKNRKHPSKKVHKTIKRFYQNGGMFEHVANNVLVSETVDVSDICARIHG